MPRSVTAVTIVWVLTAAAACSDDSAGADRDSSAVDSVATDTSPPEVEVTPTCEATLTEVDRGFVEVVAHGDCADWSVAIRDGAVAGCSLAAEVFFPRGTERMALEGFQVPAAAVIVMQDPKLAAAAVWTVGTCEPDPSCMGFIDSTGDHAHSVTCLPADGADGSVSLCGAQWVADKPATPGADNDCVCAVDCGKAAGPCEAGRCVDGACAFTPRDEGGACDDHNLCTTGDACRAGTCAGDAVTCAPPAGPCAEPGQCSPETGACVYVDSCGDNATCTAAGCACADGFSGDPNSGCADVDECASGAAQCDPRARCQNTVSGYYCVCPVGFAGDGHTCAPTTCACPWEDEGTCGPELRRLRVRVTDLWAQPVTGATLSLVDEPTGRPIRAEALAGNEIDEPLCASHDFVLSLAAPDHHAFTGTIRWSESDLTVDAPPSSDYAWAVSYDDDGPVVWVGLAHRWFASSARPARHGNHLSFLMDGEEGWGTIYDELQLAEHLVTGTSWWWESDFEIHRDPGNFYLSESERWDLTVLGALEALPFIEKKILVGQFVSQDGLFSNITVDGELTAHGDIPGDDFDYMGMANPSSGTFTVTPPAIDFGARVLAASQGTASPIAPADLIDEAPADPWHAPIAVDMTDVPLGLGALDLPLASWHQKFWTVDQRVAFVGGMNAKGTDWDTSAHLVFEPRRMAFGASSAEREAVEAREREPDLPPRKDYLVRIEGPIVQDAVDVFDARWQYQLDEEVEYADRSTPVPVEPTTASFADGAQAQIVATMPDPFDENGILETVMRAVSQAHHYIYIEDQYFRAPLVYDRIVQRMTEEPGLVLVAITNAVSEWTDLGCYQTALAFQRFRSLFPDRFKMYRLRAFDYVRTDCTFCWDETEAHFVDFDLHSKIVIVDDEYLEVGSCNSNNRGYLYEGELGIAVHDPAWVKAQRARIFENLLGPGYRGDVPVADLVAALDERARANARAYALWDDEGMDVDLDGDPLAGEWIPSGFVYPLTFDAPDECLFESVGGDIT